MTGIQETLWDFQREAYPEATLKSTLTHLIKEATEAYAEMDGDEEYSVRHTKLKEELADCAFMVYQAASLIGVDLEMEILRKLQVNRGRTWQEPDNEGEYHHA